MRHMVDDKVVIERVVVPAKASESDVKARLASIFSVAFHSAIPFRASPE